MHSWNLTFSTSRHETDQLLFHFKDQLEMLNCGFHLNVNNVFQSHLILGYWFPSSAQTTKRKLSHEFQMYVCGTDPRQQIHAKKGYELLTLSYSSFS
jgi:hypothetical protein